jgi:hypothetical protein
MVIEAVVGLADQNDSLVGKCGNQGLQIRSGPEVQNGCHADRALALFWRWVMPSGVHRIVCRLRRRSAAGHDGQRQQRAEAIPLPGENDPAAKG